MPALLAEGLSANCRTPVASTRCRWKAAGAVRGSGVIWETPTASLVTNAHVAVFDPALSITLSDGRRLDATLAARDPQLDLALLETGRPGSARRDYRRFRSAARGRTRVRRGKPLWPAWHRDRGHRSRGPNARWIQSDLRLAPGNSGGPMAMRRAATSTSTPWS